MLPRPAQLRDLALSRRDLRIVVYLVAVAAMVVLYTVVYHAGMVYLEGDASRTIFQSLEVVVETMTTTGYGADAPWSTTAMNLWVVWMQASGVGLAFFTLRLIVMPLFSAVEVDLDLRLSPKEDHVVVAGYRRDSALLVDELEDLDLDHVLVTPDREEAISLSGEGHAAIDGPLDDEETYRRASLEVARAVILDAGDVGVDALLTIRAIRPDVRILALVDDATRREILTTAGADTVLSPRQVLGRRLAEKVVATVTDDLGQTVDLGPELEFTELLVDRGSPLDGVRVRDAPVRERTGANIVGAWIDGELELPPDPDSLIRPNSVLLVLGDHDALEDLGHYTRSSRSLDRPDRVVVVGAGEVGTTAREVLDEAGIAATTVDADPGTDPDVVGDAGDREVLEAARVGEAGAVLVCLPDDSAALRTTVMARSLAPDAAILVRVNDVGGTSKTLRAGADYVLSIPQVSARLLARELRGEDVLSPASQARLVRVPPGDLAGSTLAESRVYEATGCRVVAVDAGDGVTPQVDPRRRIASTDRLIVAGTDDAIQRFVAEYGGGDPRDAER